MNKLILIALALISLFINGPAETDGTDSLYWEDLGGYTGERIVLSGTYMDFCLPDGWHTTDPAENCLLSASRGDGKVLLNILSESSEGFRADADINGRAVQIDDSGSAYKLSIPQDEDNVLSFCFISEKESDLPKELAAEIIASVSDVWE